MKALSLNDLTDSPLEAHELQPVSPLELSGRRVHVEEILLNMIFSPCLLQPIIDLRIFNPHFLGIYSADHALFRLFLRLMLHFIDGTDPILLF